jgi:hypothetical protein
MWMAKDGWDDVWVECVSENGEQCKEHEESDVQDEKDISQDFEPHAHLASL